MIRKTCNFKSETSQIAQALKDPGEVLIFEKEHAERRWSTCRMGNKEHVYSDMDIHTTAGRVWHQEKAVP